jgi:hypothetical protein
MGVRHYFVAYPANIDHQIGHTFMHNLSVQIFVHIIALSSLSHKNQLLFCNSLFLAMMVSSWLRSDNVPPSEDGGRVRRFLATLPDRHYEAGFSRAFFVQFGIVRCLPRCHANTV